VAFAKWESRSRCVSHSGDLRKGKRVPFPHGYSLFHPFKAIDNDENFVCADRGIATQGVVVHLNRERAFSNAGTQQAGNVDGPAVNAGCPTLAFQGWVLGFSPRAGGPHIDASSQTIWVQTNLGGAPLNPKGCGTHVSFCHSARLSPTVVFSPREGSKRPKRKTKGAPPARAFAVTNYC